MSWTQQYERFEGDFQQVAKIDLKVKDALEQGLLDQITDHTGSCSDDKRS